MVEVVFKGGKIQTGDRVKIPKAIMDTLKINNGKRVIIKFDPGIRKIIIQEEKKENG